MKLVSVEPKTIDPVQAEEMLKNFPYDRQRNVNKQYVSHYAQMMTNGEWVDGTEIAIAYAPNGDGKLHGHLVNGRHRLLAVIEAGMPISFVVKDFKCESDEEVAKIYGATDTGRARNIGDYLRALSIENEFGFPSSDNVKLSSTVKLIMGSFQKPSKMGLTPGEILDGMRKYSVAASMYFDAIAGAPGTSANRKMKTSAVMGVALVSLDEATRIFGDDKILKFWEGIAINDGLRIGDPRKIAHEHIFETGYRNALSKGKVVSAAYTARYTANCFNAWVSNREIKHTRVVDVSGPIVILGTKFKG